MKYAAILLLSLGFLVPCPAAEPTPEIGKVSWKRDFDAALKEAGKSKKPVLLLFQEVPG